MLIYFVFMKKDIISVNEDQHLTSAIKKGDLQALGRLYDKYAPALMGIIRRIVYAEHRADEVLQKSFMNVWSNMSAFDAAQKSLFTWLIQIARQAAIDEIKPESLEASGKVLSPVINNDNKGPGHAAIENVIFELIYLKGLSCTEAAAILELPEAELKMNIRLAIKNLNTLYIA